LLVRSPPCAAAAGELGRYAAVMTLSHATILVCTALGLVIGAATGLRYGIGWALGGGALGLAIGIASFFIFTFPYVCVQIQMEPRDPEIAREWSPPRWWANLYLLVVLLCVILAGLGSWWAVRILGGAAAA
jgi:hypothetical protein